MTSLAVVVRWELAWRNLSGQAELDSKPRANVEGLWTMLRVSFLMLVGGCV